MNIINYKQLDEIIPSSDAMIYCTCAETNQKHYLEKIQLWFKRYGKINADFYVFNDGKILEENKNFDIDNKIKIIEFDEALGRSSGCVFQGWKRSFCYACYQSLKYKYFSHIENDCFIKNLNEYEIFLKMEDVIISTICKNYNWIETAFLIINKNDIKKECYNYFNSKENQYESTVFEFRFQSIIKKYNCYGKSLRLERECDKDSDEFKVLNQCTIEQLKEFSEKYP